MRHAKFWLAPKNQVNDLTSSSFINNQQRSIPDHINVYSFSSGDESDLSNDGTPKKSILYDHVTNGDNRNQFNP